MIDVHPTGTCFDDAIDLLREAINEDVRRAMAGRELVVVHAICVFDEGPEKGEFFSHAWLEVDGNVAWQKGIVDGEVVSFSVDARELEAGLQVQRAWRYTIPELVAENQKRGTYGPWEPELLALTKQGKKNARSKENAR